MGAEILLLALWQAAQGSPAGAKSAPSGNLRTLLDSGPAEQCFDVFFVGDGYQAADLAEGRYAKDVERAAEQLLETVPFSWYRKSINVRMLELESREAGCDIDQANEVDTLLDCAFDMKPKEFLRFRAHEQLRSLVESAGAVDCVFVLVNTPRRGAACSALMIDDQHLMPAPTFSKDPASFGLALHALGHTMGRLNDEFTGSSTFCPEPDMNLPPGGANVVSVTSGTTSDARDDLPWKHFRGLPGANKHDWMHEGAGRRAKDVYRPWRNCRMRESEAPFCPVCTEELAKVLQKASALPWNDEEYHRAHPLELWKK